MTKKPRPYMPGSTLRRPEKEMRRFNPEKRARRESEGLVYGELYDWAKRQQCVGSGHELHPRCEYYPPERRGNEGHHPKTIGSGGQDRNNILTCCPLLHDEFHRLGLTQMCDRYKMDWRSVACELTEAYDRETGEVDDE